MKINKSNLIKEIKSKLIDKLELKCWCFIECDVMNFRILSSTSPILVNKAIAYLISEIPCFIKYINISFVDSLLITDKIEIKTKNLPPSLCIKEITFINEAKENTIHLIESFVQIIKELKVTEVIFNNFKKSEFDQIFNYENKNIENLKMIRIENSEDLDLSTFDSLLCNSLVSNFY